MSSNYGSQGGGQWGGQPSYPGRPNNPTQPGYPGQVNRPGPSGQPGQGGYGYPNNPSGVGNPGGANQPGYRPPGGSYGQPGQPYGRPNQPPPGYGGQGGYGGYGGYGGQPGPQGTGKSNNTLILIVVGLIAAVLVGAVIIWAIVGRGGDSPEPVPSPSPAPPSSTVTNDPEPTSEPEPTTTSPDEPVGGGDTVNIAGTTIELPAGWTVEETDDTSVTASDGLNVMLLSAADAGPGVDSVQVMQNYEQQMAEKMQDFEIIVPADQMVSGANGNSSYGVLEGTSMTSSGAVDLVVLSTFIVTGDGTVLQISTLGSPGFYVLLESEIPPFYEQVAHQMVD